MKTRPVDIARVLAESRATDPSRSLREEPAAYGLLDESVRTLFDELARLKIRFVLVGGLAVRHYVAGRNTGDIDLVMALRDARRIGGLEIFHVERDFAQATYAGIRVDLLLPANRLFALVARRYAREGQLLDRTVRVATPEGLILMKLFALPSLYRQGQMAKVTLYQADITELADMATANLRRLLVVLRPHLLESDHTALGEIVTEIEQFIGRFGDQPFGGSPLPSDFDPNVD